MQLIIPAEAAHDTVYQLGEVHARPRLVLHAPCCALWRAPLSLHTRPCGTSVITAPARLAARPAAVPQPAAAARHKLGANAGRVCQRADSLALRFRTLQAGVMQFKDLNADKSAFQRTYANQARAR